uniref:Uncharacterized protein n=1 Tax=Periophthalmus magnuspinnatus TaxID=409849 RepID=A0A3B4BJ40_9GOBI
MSNWQIGLFKMNECKSVLITTGQKMDPHNMYRPPSVERMSPGQQPPSPCVKGSQRVVTLAQHISVSNPQPLNLQHIHEVYYIHQSYKTVVLFYSIGSRSPPNASQPPAFFSKLTENTSAIVRSKKQEMTKKMTVVGNENDFNAGQPGTEIFNIHGSESPGNSIGLEAIIRKALMGKYDDQSEDRSPSNPGSSGPVAGVDGRAEDGFAQGGTNISKIKLPLICRLFTLHFLTFCLVGGAKSSKGNGRSNGRKTKSPGPGLSGGERPSSVSSVHSEGDYNRRTPLSNRVLEERPSSTGSTPTPFAYNTLTMRFPSGTVSAPSPSPGQGASGPGAQGRWEEEPKPLLMSQYETLSDSE